MRHELTGAEIIRTGRAYETRAAWERARDFAVALYGASVASVTYSQTTFPEQDHRLRTIQSLAFDAAGRLMPYDFAASWWAGRNLPTDALANPMKVTQDDLARGLGSGFPDAIRDELHAFAEERLGVETLHTWLGWNESETLAWMFDLTSPPSIPHARITDQTGATLAGQDIIAAGVERDMLARWSGARQYVHTLYGERAVKADVIAFSRYNDNTYDRDITLDVFDINDTRLFYDLRQPWWQQFGVSEQQIAKYDEEHDPSEPVDTEYDPAGSNVISLPASGEIERMAMELLGAEFIATRNSWDTDVSSYDLSHAPELRFPQLWAEDDNA